MNNTRSRTLLWLLVAFVATVAAMAVIGALAYSGPDTYDGYGMMSGGWGWAMGLMVIPGILLVVIIVVALSGTCERQVYAYPAYSQPQSPLDILNQRYARGEIGQEEYQRVKNQLVH